MLNNKTDKEIIKTTKSKITVLDLFCGCGGLSKGLTNAGLNVVAGIDIWNKAIETYTENNKHIGLCKDLTKFSAETFSQETGIKHIDLLVGGPPCFVAGTQVLTNTGYKNIENVQINDKLLTHTGKFQKINNLQQKIYSQKIYEIDITYHPETIICTEEHPFYVRTINNMSTNKSFDEPIWKKAKDLTPSDYFGMVINRNNIIPEFTFDINIKLDTKDQWFMMGYFVGNGIIEDDTYNIKFIIDNDDKDIIEIIEKTLNIINQNNESNIYKHYSCSNYVWFNILKHFFNNKYEKYIPEWVYDAPNEFIKEFINGFIKTKYINLNLAYDLQRLYLKLGHISSIIKTEYNIYTVEVILNDFKNKSSFIENNYVWLSPEKIFSIKIAENINVYNFEVDNDNSYIVHNTIVHNCQGFSIAGKRDNKDPRNSLFMEYVKYLNYFKPKAFIMENVIGILSMKTSDNKNVIDIILEELGNYYNCKYYKLSAADFEVPQIRRRTIFIGFRKDLNIIPSEPVSVSAKTHIAASTILEKRENIDKKYFLSEKAITGINKKKTTMEAKGFGFGASYIDPDKPCFTIPARYWKDGYDALVKYSDTEIRRLTEKELAKIQTFPDDYIFKGTKKDIIMQIGNAVACRFAYHLGKYINNKLELTNDESIIDKVDIVKNIKINDIKDNKDIKDIKDNKDNKIKKVIKKKLITIDDSIHEKNIIGEDNESIDDQVNKKIAKIQKKKIFKENKQNINTEIVKKDNIINKQKSEPKPKKIIVKGKKMISEPKNDDSDEYIENNQ